MQPSLASPSASYGSSARPPLRGPETLAPYAGQPRAQVGKDMKSHGPAHTGPVGQAPSGRSVCIFTSNDREAIWRSRWEQFKAVGMSCAVLGGWAVLGTGLVLNSSTPDDPPGDETVAKNMTCAALLPQLPTAGAAVAWPVSAWLERRALQKSERTAVADITPLDHLRRHVDNANAMTTSEEAQRPLAHSALVRAIEFIHELQATSLQSESDALTNDQVATAMADLIDGAVSVADKAAFKTFTESLTQMAVSGRCEPKTVLGLLGKVATRTLERLKTHSDSRYHGREPELRAWLKQARGEQLATAIINSLEPLERALSKTERSVVSGGWEALAGNYASLAQVVDFTNLVFRLNTAEGDQRRTALAKVATYIDSSKRRSDPDAADSVRDGVREALDQRAKAAATAASGEPLPLESTGVVRIHVNASTFTAATDQV